MTAGDLEALADGWREVAKVWPTLVAGITPNHCVLATSVAVAAARQVGVEMTPVACAAAAMNEMAMPLLLGGVPVREWPDEAWSVGVNPDEGPSRRFNGHLVAVFDDRILVDLSAGQFHRPERGIHVEPLVMVAGVDADRVEPPAVQRVTWSRTSDDGTTVMFTERRELARWRTAPDWRNDPPAKVVDPVAEALCRALTGAGG